MFIRKLVRADLTPLSLVNEQNELLSCFTDLSENKHTDNLNAIVETYVSFISSMSCEKNYCKRNKTPFIKAMYLSLIKKLKYQKLQLQCHSFNRIYLHTSEFSYHKPESSHSRQILPPSLNNIYPG